MIGRMKRRSKHRVRWYLDTFVGHPIAHSLTRTGRKRRKYVERPRGKQRGPGGGFARYVRTGEVRPHKSKRAWLDPFVSFPKPEPEC